MAKVTEKEIVRLLEDRAESLRREIKKFSAAIDVLTGSESEATQKLHKKEKKLIKEAKTDLKKDRKKTEKKSKAHMVTASPAQLTTPLLH